MKPGYDGRPVVLVHLPLSRAHPGLSACSFEPFTPADESVTGVPMLLCLACQRSAGLGGHDSARDASGHQHQHPDDESQHPQPGG